MFFKTDCSGEVAIKEVLAIYQNQSNKILEFERYGCNWWKDWDYQMEQLVNHILIILNIIDETKCED